MRTEKRERGITQDRHRTAVCQASPFMYANKCSMRVCVCPYVAYYSPPTRLGKLLDCTIQHTLSSGYGRVVHGTQRCLLGGSFTVFVVGLHF